MPIQFVGTNENVSTTQARVTYNSTAGNALFVATLAQSLDLDSAGNSYTYLGGGTVGGIGVSIYYCLNAAAITYVQAYSGAGSICIGEYSGIGSISGSLVSNSGAPAGSAATPNVSLSSLSQVTDWTIGFFVITDNVTITISSDIGNLRLQGTSFPGGVGVNHDGYLGLVDNTGLEIAVNTTGAQNWGMFAVDAVANNPRPPKNRCAEFWG
jgi:hypothetical protein